MNILRKEAKHLGSWLLVLIAAGAVMGVGCGSSSGGGTTTPTTTPTPTPTTGIVVQVERLARPAINEGLVVTNDFINAYNAIPPSADLSPGAAAVVTEAQQTFDAVDAAVGGDNVASADIAEGFLPDVMRIDTTIASPVGTPAYTATRAEILLRSANDNRVLPVPIAGRKIEDDVMDATLTVLSGQALSDNVPYTRPASGAGSANGGIGHNLLNGQTAPLGPATFPFLAPAN